MRSLRLALLCAALLAAAGCSSFLPSELPDERPPLADMEEPLALLQEPQDEDARRALPLGGFTGITVADARRTLDELEGDAAGVRVARVVENSPADAAGVAEDDILVEAVDAAGVRHALSYPSEWRAIELAAAPGSTIAVTVDRAGALRRAEIGVVARVRPTERAETARLRDEQKVGVVVRTATEVEARAAGLGPGGGAVVVGLSGGSPWRRAGLRFEDLIASIDGEPVGHPQAVLDAIRASEAGDTLVLGVVRGGERLAIEAPISRRASEVREVDIPVLFDYTADRGDTEWSALLGLVSYRSTIAAWQLRLLWLIKLGGGDADRLVPVGD